MNKLNLGCGKDIRKGFANVDFIDFGKDVIKADLEKKLPFEDNTFDYVLMHDIYEHIENHIQLMEEVWRICKPYAIVDINSPHFASLSTYFCPFHYRGVSKEYFMFFGKNGYTLNYALKCEYKLLSSKIILRNFPKFMERLANKYSGFYECSLCYMIRPSYVKAKLEVRKENGGKDKWL